MHSLLSSPRGLAFDIRVSSEAKVTHTLPNQTGAANSAPRLHFRAFGFSIHLVAGGAALTGAVADLAR
jgi:hypothetical protein